MNIGDLVAMEVSDMVRVLEIAETECEEILNSTKELIDKAEIALAPEEEEELVSASAVPAYNGLLNGEAEGEGEEGADKFSEAEKRLREELAAFKLK